MRLNAYVSLRRVIDLGAANIEVRSRDGKGTVFGAVTTGLAARQRIYTGLHMTPRWRKPDSNSESRSEKVFHAEPMVCTTLRWREMDSKFQFRAR